MLRQGHRGAILRVGPRDGLAGRLERELFERGCAVFVLDVEHEIAARALAASGALVILAGGSETGAIVESFQAAGGPAHERLAADDGEALGSLVSLLERLQVLMPVNGWIDAGGGI
jgi:hypothetical protein